MAGCAAGDEDSRRAVRLALTYLCNEILANCHTEIEIVALVAKATGHTATLHGRGDHIESSGAQDVDGLGRGIAGTLLAMRVVEELCTKMRLASRKYFSEINSLLLRGVPYHLQRFETVGGKGRYEVVAVEQVLAIETEHGEHARFQHGDLATAV